MIPLRHANQSFKSHRLRFHLESYLYSLHLFEQKQLTHLISLTPLNCFVTPLEFADSSVTVSGVCACVCARPHAYVRF